jgi:peptidoglycan/LPS O-acetylase OafA/YrhL
LDGYRGIAFLVVFATHYIALPWGSTGVDAFFVLSGFLITGILYDTRDDPNRVRNFYIRRGLRIFPLYYGLILLMVLLYPVFRWDWNIHWLVWPFYLGNFARFVHPAVENTPWQLLGDAQLLSRTHPIKLYMGHFWSLCIEEHFYLIWPCIVFLVRDRRKLLWICALSVPICTLARIVAVHHLPAFMIDDEITLRATPFRFDALLLGGFLALIRRGPSPKMLIPWARICALTLALAFVVWHLTHTSVWLSYWKYSYPVWGNTWSMTAFEVFYASVMLLAIEWNSLTFRVLSVKPLRWLGRLSYGAYIFHDILHEPFEHLAYRLTPSHARWLAAVLALAFTVSAAWASFRWLESPFIRAKNRLAAR